MTRAGMAGAPPALLVTPEAVARKILLAVRTRPRVLNAVPWQVAFVALAELFPRITDAVLERNPALVGTQDTPPLAAPQRALEPPRAAQPFETAQPSEAAQPSESVDAFAVSGATGFDAAIEPLRRRMERVKLREEFVRELLRDGDVLEVHDVALRWAGMPNKNERAATVEVLDALASAGYLHRDGERYRVLRPAD
jgi:hypothetical protein